MLQIFNEVQAIQLNSLFRSEEDQKIFEAISYEINGESLSTRSVAMYGIVTVAIAIVIVLTITIGIDENVSTRSNKANDLASNDTAFLLKINNPEHMIINLWALQHDIDSYQLVAGYKSFIVKQVISHLKETNSPALTKYSEKQISEFLKGNILI